MHIPHINGKVIYGTSKALGLHLAQFGGAEFVELTLLQGGTIPAHSPDMPVTFYVATGTGRVVIDGKPFTVGAGDIVASQPGSTRELVNTGDGDFKLLVVKHKA